MGRILLTLRSLAALKDIYTIPVFVEHDENLGVMNVKEFLRTIKVWLMTTKYNNMVFGALPSLRFYIFRRHRACALLASIDRHHTLISAAMDGKTSSSTPQTRPDRMAASVSQPTYMSSTPSRRRRTRDDVRLMLVKAIREVLETSKALEETMTVSRDPPSTEGDYSSKKP